MRVVFTETRVKLYREDEDPKYYGTANAAGESRLLYKLQQKLKENGIDVIKKRTTCSNMYALGHTPCRLCRYGTVVGRWPGQKRTGIARERLS
jgi:hypothetical protein